MFLQMMMMMMMMAEFWKEKGGLNWISFFHFAHDKNTTTVIVSIEQISILFQLPQCPELLEIH